MRSLRTAAFLAATLLAAAAAQSQAPTRVRGTITAVDGNVVTVKSREGQELKLELAPNATFAYMKRMRLEDVQPGTPMGTTAVKDASGDLVAREIHLFSKDKPIPNEGHRPWDLEPNSTMTNATVASVTPAKGGGPEITLKYPGGEQKVRVPPGIPIVMAVEGDRSLLVPGEYAFIAVNMDAGGKLTATRLQVAKDGIRPPQ
jgi:hypothetical protein